MAYNKGQRQVEFGLNLEVVVDNFSLAGVPRLT